MCIANVGSTHQAPDANMDGVVLRSNRTTMNIALSNKVLNGQHARNHKRSRTRATENRTLLSEWWTVGERDGN